MRVLIAGSRSIGSAAAVDRALVRDNERRGRAADETMPVIALPAPGQRTQELS